VKWPLKAEHPIGHDKDISSNLIVNERHNYFRLAKNKNQRTLNPAQPRLLG
jgi:hypothetical protein